MCASDALIVLECTGGKFANQSDVNASIYINIRSLAPGPALLPPANRAAVSMATCRVCASPQADYNGCAVVESVLIEAACERVWRWSNLSIFLLSSQQQPIRLQHTQLTPHWFPSCYWSSGNICLEASRHILSFYFFLLPFSFRHVVLIPS